MAFEQGTAGADGPPLTEAERADARRFLGYLAPGADNAGLDQYRYFAAYGQMEHRLNKLSATEAAAVREKLAALAALDATILAAAANLGADSAEAWRRNRDGFRITP